MEAVGAAARVKGAKPGIPDTWTLTGPAPHGTSPAADPHSEQPGPPDGSPGDAGKNETAGGTAQDSPAGTDDPAPQDGENAQASINAAPGPEAEQPQPGSHDDAPGDSDHEDTAPGERDEAATDSGDETSGAPDPALITDLTERITQIKAAAGATATVLAGGEDLPAALADLDEIYEQAAQARRSLKAAIGGKNAPADSGTRSWPIWTPTPARSSPRTRSTRSSTTAPARSPTPWTPWSTSAKPNWPPTSRAGSAGPPNRTQPPPGPATRPARRKAAPNWRVPREDPRRRPGRQARRPHPRSRQPRLDAARP